MKCLKSSFARPALLAALMSAFTFPAAAQDKAPPPPNCAGAVAQAGTVAISCAMLAEIDEAAQQTVMSGQSAGLAVGLVQNGQLIFSKGYGKANLEWNQPVTPDTVFQIFSITKTFTAAAIMQMAERGQLNIDDKLSKYFPDFPRASEVTLRQLLSHTSGIHDIARPGITIDKSYNSSEQIFKIVATQPQMYDFEPGTKYAYSNSNYMILARIIEKLSGKEYGQYMAENILSRADLKNTAVDHNVDVVPNRASGYILDQGKLGHFLNGDHIDISFPFGAGTIRSTVPDLANWFTALFEGRVVSPASLREMMAPARVTGGKLAGDVLASGKPAGSRGYYGLGFESGRREGHLWIGHGGGFTSFNSQVSNYSADGLMTVILANSFGSAASMDTKIAKIVFSRNATPQLQK